MVSVVFLLWIPYLRCVDASVALPRKSLVIQQAMIWEKSIGLIIKLPSVNWLVALFLYPRLALLAILSYTGISNLNSDCEQD